MRIEVDLNRQILALCDAQGRVVAAYPVSTARNGPGEQSGSLCTPRGLHKVRARIGDGQPLNSVFVGRRPTGEVYTPEMGLAQPQRDWILTRIRYIYIHGTPDEGFVQEPASHGCIRMRNADIAELFDRAPACTPVMISA
jgi:L,D-transpeptidase YbiS